MLAHKIEVLEHEFHDLARRHRALRVHALNYLRHARPAALLSVPIIYLGIAPFAMLDLFLALYQATCFRLFGVPRVERSRYITLDRAKLQYLNGIEKVNCAYCSYASGLAAYFAEIAARTEQHWCPIKHAKQAPLPHSRYHRFFDYGDAESYRREVERVRRDFSDLDED